MSGPFGTGGLVIAGHHISYGLLAVLLSVPVAGLAIYQFRHGGGGSQVSTGTGLPSVDANGNLLDANGNIISPGGGGGGGGASDAALQNFGQQLQQYLDGMRALGTGVPGVQNSYYTTNQYVAATKAIDTTTPAPFVSYQQSASGSIAALLAGATSPFLQPPPAPAPAPAFVADPTPVNPLGHGPS